MVVRASTALGGSELQGPDGVVDDVAAHVAQGPGAEVPPAPPEDRGVGRVVRTRPDGAQPQVPGQRGRYRRLVGGPADPLLPQLAGPVRPDVDLADASDDAGAQPFVGQAGAFGGVALVTHLRGDAGLAGRLGHRAALGQGARQRLLAIDRLARAEGGHRGDGVDVIRRADRNRVDVLRLLVEHFAKVLVAPRPGKGLEGAGGTVVIDIAKGDDIGAETGEGGDVAAAHAAGPDARQVDTFARRHETGPAEDVAGHDGDQGPGGGRGQERPPRALRGVGFIRLETGHGGSSDGVRKLLPRSAGSYFLRRRVARKNRRRCKPRRPLASSVRRPLECTVPTALARPCSGRRHADLFGCCSGPVARAVRHRRTGTPGPGGRPGPRGATDVRAFARTLLQLGCATPYQVNQLFQDNGASLLLGSYVVLERLGSGGMGNVFKARHQKLGRVVAVKFIHRNKLDNPAVVKRFDREIKLAGQLDHPNIVHALDAEDVAGAQVLVMEYLEGIDLGKRVKESGPLPVRAACDYIRQAALGLQHAHEKGLVHRDIKPSNLMLLGASGPSGSGGVIKLLDLGLALVQQPLIDRSVSGPLTVAGKVVGTVDFIAPEQARDASNVDSRADLYGLGCTFYYLLAGRAPFDGATLTNKLFKHALEEPEALDHLRGDVPPVVSSIIRRLMAKKPEDRYQTAAEVAAALEQVLKPRSARATVPATQGTAKDRATPAPPPAPRSKTPRREDRAARALEPAVRAVATPVATVTAPRRRQKVDHRCWLLLNGAGLVVLLLMLGLLTLVLWKAFGSGVTSTAHDSARLSPAEREAQAELDALQGRLQAGAEDRKMIRQELIAFRARRMAFPQALKAATILHDLPSPLDALDPGEIPPERRFKGQPPELVAVVPTQATTALMAPEDARALTLSARPVRVGFVDLVTGQPGRPFERLPGNVAILALAPTARGAFSPVAARISLSGTP